MTIRRSSAVTDFAVSRFARLYPAFIVSVLLNVFIILVFPDPVQKLTIWQVIVNLTMLQDFIGVPAVEPVYWSLSYEIGFYTLIALVFASGMIRRIEIFGILWVTLSFVLLKLFPVLGEHIPWRLQTAVSLPYASLFFAGIMYYKIWSEGVTPARVALILMCYIEHVLYHFPIMIAIMTVNFAVFSLCVMGRASWLASRPLVFLGTISYSLYLIHGTLGWRLQLWNHALGLPPLANLLFATSVTICVAAIMAYLVEGPANRAIRGIYRRARSSRPLEELGAA